jgi:hypothetical protein
MEVGHLSDFSLINDISRIYYTESTADFLNIFLLLMAGKRVRILAAPLANLHQNHPLINRLG